jgi:hypothetical protein
MHLFHHGYCMEFEIWVFAKGSCHVLLLVTVVIYYCFLSSNEGDCSPDKMGSQTEHHGACSPKAARTHPVAVRLTSGSAANTVAACHTSADRPATTVGSCEDGKPLERMN